MFNGPVMGTAGSVRVTGTSSSFERVDESFLWTGSFTLNDFLLWNTDSGDSIVSLLSVLPCKGPERLCRGTSSALFSNSDGI